MKSLFAATLLAIAAVATAVPSVDMRTSAGLIVIELDAEKAPITVDNFLKYAKAGQYDGTIFHRVIDGFMIQGGGYTPSMEEKKTGQPIANEAKNGLKNKRGTIAMARGSDPNSATAQFFINQKDNPFLDYPGNDGWGSAVFGRVTQGTEVIDKIAKARTDKRGAHQNVPVEPIVKAARVYPPETPP
jgi:cyclophilin family peptidyl-prolyl cis-trans isomerase